MTMRRYAVILPVLIVLLAAAIFIAANGQEGAQAETKNPVTQVTPTATPEATMTPDSTSSDSSDAWSDGADSSSSSDDPESSIGSGGSDTTGGTVLDGVGDTENVDAGNRLSSAKVVRQNVNDGEQEYARYCFKDDIQTLNKGEASKFAVLGPDSSDGLEASDVRLDENRDNCAVAGFESGTDLKSYTVAAVQGGVVKNRDGQKNIADTASLEGARTSNNRTAGPDLVRV